LWHTCATADLYAPLSLSALRRARHPTRPT
jgi:hypothetical protein